MVTLGADVAKASEAVEMGPPVVTGVGRGGGLPPPPPLGGGVTDGSPVPPLPVPPAPAPPPDRTGGPVGQLSAVGCVV